jgi:hypothetical protein
MEKRASGLAAAATLSLAGGGAATRRGSSWRSVTWGTEPGGEERREEGAVREYSAQRTFEKLLQSPKKKYSLLSML